MVEQQQGDVAFNGPRFGILLRSVREKRGLSQRTLADRAGITRSRIQQMEDGRCVREPLPETMSALCRALLVTKADLTGEGEADASQP